MYSMSCIYLYGAQRLRSGCKSWQRLQNCARCRWTTRLSLVHPLKFHHHLGTHVRHPRFTPRIVRHETEDSVKTEGRKFLFWRGKILTSNRRELTNTTPGGSLWEGEGNENYRNATIPVSIPGSIPGNYGKSHLCF